jgi:hypothetical protein
MDNTSQELVEMATKPTHKHEWLQKLVGAWRIESEMSMEPGGPKMKTNGTASVKSLDGLWAFSENKETMPNGQEVTTYFALGYDVSFKEYRGCIVMSASSHLWKYVGNLSDDGKTMTLDCEGPNMTDDGTALYRDIIELIDENHRVLTSYVQDKDGNWQEFAVSHYSRA